MKYWENISHLFVYASLINHEFSLHGTQSLVEGIVENLDITLDTSMSEYLTVIKYIFLWL